MLYVIGPDGSVSQRYANFNKMVWMTMVHFPMFRIKHQKFLEILTVFRPSHDTWHRMVLYKLCVMRWSEEFQGFFYV